MLYRIKQFYWDITCRFKKLDYKFINKYLTLEEIQLFEKLSISEQFHCIRVANNAMEQGKNIYKLNKFDIDKLIKICLLHDIGKIECRVNVLEKSILVICNRLLKDRLKSFSNKSKKIDTYYFHAEKGADILSKIGYSDDIIYVIRNHHRKVNRDNIFLNILKYSDNIS